MKKIGFILLSTSILFLFGCSKETSQQDEYTEVIGTITYHNPELDRGSGEETRLDRIVKLYIAGKDRFIQLGCIASEYSLKLDSDVILPVLNQDKTYSFVITPFTQTLPSSLSGTLVKLKITKPIYDYNMSVELPDRGRIGDCTADVKVKDIEVIGKAGIIKTRDDMIKYISSGDQRGENDTIIITGEYFKIYSSLDLGFEFSVKSYDKNYPEDYSFLVRSGSIVYINDNYSPGPYQHIEILEKLPNETVKEAIERIFLSGSGIDSGCFVEVSEDTQKSFVINNVEATKTCEGLCYPSDFCGEYALGGAISFFMGKDSSTKFYYIHGGQDPWEGLDNAPWYTNIKFL